MKKPFIYFLKFMVSSILIFWILKKINFNDFKHTFSHISLHTLSWIIFFAILQTYFMGLRWYYVQQKFMDSVSLKTSLKYIWMGQFFSQFMPGGMISGDIIRGWYLKSAHLNLKKISQIIILEKFFLIIGIILFCLPYCAFHFPSLLIPITFLALGGIWYIFKKRLHFKNVCPIFICTIIINGFACLNLYFLMQDFNPHISLLSAFIFMPVITFVGTFPISFGGWGIREGATIYFLKDLGFSSEVSLTISLALVFSSFISSLPGLFTWISIRNQKSHRSS
ncbi:MAG: flippase-like domain-containing protein [Proteobacteria bacterium]|nr:flippase-like domain-containing protein [Pseudomonadota bacterium]